MEAIIDANLAGNKYRLSYSFSFHFVKKLYFSKINHLLSSQSSLENQIDVFDRDLRFSYCLTSSSPVIKGYQKIVMS